jgi:hypothetical protein
VYATRADINKLTTGPLNVDIYLRIPAGSINVATYVNGASVTGSHDSVTGRVRIQTALNTSAGNNVLLVTYGDYDSVQDGIPDWWRRQYFGGDGTTTNSNSCASCDADGDGMNSLAELMAGTVPTDPSSALRIVSIQRSGNDFIINFTSITGKTYRLERCDDLSGAVWSTVQDNIPGNGTGIPITDPGAATQPHRYYRAKLLP